MAIYNVKKDGSGDFTKIQEAIMAASEGDVIQIEAGLFEENIDIHKPVTLMGAGRQQTIIQTSLKSNIVRSGVRVSGSNIITFAAGTAGFEVGRVVTGTGIPTNIGAIRIVQVNEDSIVMSANASTSGTANVTMAQVNDAGVRMRSNGPVIKDLKIIGFDGAAPNAEIPALYFRNTGLGAAACTNFLVENCEIEAKGESALVSDFAVGVGNGEIRNCLITGKTFVGEFPGIGDQFTVPNVPRVLVFFGSSNQPMKLIGNTFEAITGGLTIDGLPSFNIAVTVDAANSEIRDNIINGQHGTAFALRVRNNTSIIEDNVNYSFPSRPNQGYLIGPTGEQVQGLNIGSNISIEIATVAASQDAPGAPLKITPNPSFIEMIPAISASEEFSDRSNWKLISYVYKHNQSNKRLVFSVAADSQERSLPLKEFMEAGETYELLKVIVSDAERKFLSVSRPGIPEANGSDFTLA
jgi:hypothetical protein